MHRDLTSFVTTAALHGALASLACMVSAASFAVAPPGHDAGSAAHGAAVQSIGLAAVPDSLK